MLYLGQYSFIYNVTFFLDRETILKLGKVPATKSFCIFEEYNLFSVSILPWLHHKSERRY